MDCIAAVLTIRAGKRATSLADVKAIFATTTYKVISNAQNWYEEQGETGLSPVIHIRALANLAWLRKPALSVNLKLHELVTLCQAALRPSKQIWNRFILHLNILENKQLLTSDESVAVVVSELTEDLLGDIDDDADVSTLDEIIDRVRVTYEAEANTRISQSELKSQELIAAAERREHNAVEESRRLKLTIEGRANKIVRTISKTITTVLYVVALVGAIALIFGHSFHYNFIGIILGLAVIVFIILELVGIFKHISHLNWWIETTLLPTIRRALGADPSPEYSALSLLGLNSIDKQENNEQN